MGENHVGRLKELMDKHSIEPIYETIANISGTHNNTFSIRVSCRVPSQGRNCSATGEGSSKKIAKQTAALNFIQNFLEENNGRFCQMRRNIECNINVNSTNKLILLQIICTKYDLPKPDYVDVLQAGPSHAPKFTVACKVGSLRMEGKGPKKADARVDATTKMIQLILEKQEIYELFETQSKPTANENEIVCLSDCSTGTNLTTLIFGRRRSSGSSSPEKLREKSPEIVMNIKTFKNINTSNAVCGDSESRDTVQKITLKCLQNTDGVRNSKSLDNPECDSIVMKLENNDNEGKVVLIQTNSRSMDNSSEHEVNNRNLSPTSSKGSSRNISRLDSMNKIDTTLENIENQLYNEILDNLNQRNQQVEKKVIILFNEFDVLINHDRRAKISDACGECTDQSIRIACLSRLLLNYKEHMKNNP